MSITSSTIFRSVDLGGGRSFITEHHTDHVGVVHEINYAGVQADSTALLAEHATQLAAQLAEREAEELLQ